MNWMKRPKGMIPEDELPRLEGVHYTTGEEQKATVNSSRKNGAAGPKQNDTQLWMCLVVKAKPNAVKNNIAQERGVLGP